MPTQEKENQTGAEQAAETQQQEQQNGNFKESEKLLPFLNVKAEDHYRRIANLEEKISVRESKIEKNLDKINRLNTRADRLEDRNRFLTAMFGDMPFVKNIVKKNEEKIKTIREEKIPKRENKIKNHKNKIQQLNAKMDKVQHKLDRVLSLNYVIKSFKIGANQERRQAFSQALNDFQKSTVDCMTDKINAMKEQRKSLLEQYDDPKKDAADKFQIQKKIESLNLKIDKLTEKIEKVEMRRNSERADAEIDSEMNRTAEKTAKAAKQENISMSELSEEISTGETIQTERQEIINDEVIPDFFPEYHPDFPEYDEQSQFSAIPPEYQQGLPEPPPDAYFQQGYPDIPPDYRQNMNYQQQEQRQELVKINPDFYRSLPKNQRSVNVQPKSIADKVMKHLEQMRIPFSAVERKGGLVAITVAKQNANIIKSLISQEQGNRAKQLINPEFFRRLAKEDRYTQRMSEEQAREKIAELDAKGIAHSAVINGENSGVTVHKANAQQAFFSVKQLRQKATKKSQQKSSPQREQKRKSQGLE